MEIKGNQLQVMSNTPQCSRVDWYIDGNLKTTIVTDCSESEELLGSASNPDFVIQSCKICKDSVVNSKANSYRVDDTFLIGRWKSDAFTPNGKWKHLVDGRPVIYEFTPTQLLNPQGVLNITY